MYIITIEFNKRLASLKSNNKNNQIQKYRIINYLSKEFHLIMYINQCIQIYANENYFTRKKAIKLSENTFKIMWD